MPADAGAHRRAIDGSEQTRCGGWRCAARSTALNAARERELIALKFFAGLAQRRDRRCDRRQRVERRHQAAPGHRQS